MFFFFNDTATTEIYTLSLHDALPIFVVDGVLDGGAHQAACPFLAHGLDANAAAVGEADFLDADRKSTRLNSSHANISYAVFCLKKKKPRITRTATKQVNHLFSSYRTR